MDIKDKIQIYNTPLEVGLRTLIILDKIGETGADIEKIMYIDYLSLNTKDIGGEESIHAPIPNRSLQVYARKKLIQKGLTILASKELIKLNIDSSGFIYRINEVGKKFLEYFSSSYFIELTERVKWVIDKFGHNTSVELRVFINKKMKDWSSEFILGK